MIWKLWNAKLSRKVTAVALAGSFAVLAGCGDTSAKTSSVPASPLVHAAGQQPESAAPHQNGNANSETTSSSAAVETPKPGPRTLETPEAKPAHAPKQSPKKSIVLQSPSEDEIPEDLHKPQVFLSSTHAATCLIQQSDLFPAFTLPDLQGKQVLVSSVYGDRLTVVVFWSLKHPYARDQFSRLQEEVVDRYRRFGVSVVAIDEGDSPADILSFAEQAGVTATCLQDSEGIAFQKVATAKLPRTYLLDAGGAVIWFDIEYSFASRHELHNAIHWAIREGS